MADAESNRDTYDSAEAVSFYREYAGLQTPEESWFRDFSSQLRGARILDLGMGAGRTTAVLAPIAAHYVGIDYSAPLVAAARKRCPGVELRQGDARDLVGVEDDEFDVVLFTFNGIDSVGHDDRMRVLSEVHRALRPSGLFIFATHNLDFRGLGRFSWPWPPRPTRSWLGRMRRSLHSYQRHRTMRRQEHYDDGWAIINDEGHDYGLLNYYITFSRQVSQLDAAGFDLAACYRLDGRRVDGLDEESVYLNYVATRR